MKKNKLLAVLLALAMTLSLLPTAALAAESAVGKKQLTSEACTYTLSNAVTGEMDFVYDAGYGEPSTYHVYLVPEGTTVTNTGSTLRMDSYGYVGSKWFGYPELMYAKTELTIAKSATFEGETTNTVIFNVSTESTESVSGKLDEGIWLAVNTIQMPGTPSTPPASPSGTAVTAETTTLTSGDYYLSEDVTLTSALTVAADATVTLDLNGHTITRTGTAILNNGTLTIKDSVGGGKVVSTENVAVGAGHNSVTTIESGTFNGREGAVITGYATGATINIKDGTFIATDNAVVAGNGNSTDANNGNTLRVNPNTINISGGTFNGGITSSGYVACGIYAPWKDNINVSGGTFKITGGAGIVARAGNVNVTGGTFNTTGNTTGKVGDSRVVVPCSAIVFDSAANYPAMTPESKIAVTGGKFTSEVAVVTTVVPDSSTETRVAVSGGTFSDVSALGYLASDADVTVKLAADATPAARVTIPDNTTVTLDLNGHTITRAGTAILNNGTLTIKDSVGGGKVVSTENVAVGAGHNSVTTIESGTFNGREGAVITGYATGATINIKDGTFIATDNAVVAGNGNSTDANNGNTLRVNPNTINISGGTFNGGITSSGYVACGIYAPWKDNINVSGGTFKITGGAGIVARAGNVNVTGGTFNTTGNTTGKVGDSRVVVPCSAIVFDSAANYPAMTPESKIAVTGGKFTSEVAVVTTVVPDSSTETRVAVSGGTFSAAPTDYLAEGYAAAKVNGEYIVGAANHSVTFESNGGTTVASETVAHGVAVTEPAAPTKTGYNFAGWYSDSALTTPYVFTDAVLADVTLYAKWDIINYTITYNMNGGTNAENNPTTYTVETGFKLAYPTKDSFTFLGWTMNGGKDIIKDVVVSAGSTGPATFTAQWSYTGGSAGSSGGGGGGSSSSNTTTTTEKNDDGSTTTTVTDKTTGTVTETTKNTDGSTTTVETKKDGTVTETNKTADGTTGTVVTDKDGDVTSAKASVSTSAAKEAAATGDAVTLPVEVPAVSSTEDAPTVQVSVPKSAGSVKVEIPVEQVTPGTVAVIVNADCTEKIVSTSVVTENGVVLTLDGSATVKVIDNSKDFADVPASNVFYNEISSLSAREIMIGKTEDTFDLYNSVTLNQIANVAGRITGAVEVSDYAGGIAWGAENGLKTGDEPATRGEVLKALYVAAGSPAVEDTSILSIFNDSSDIPADMAAIAAWAAQNGILKGTVDGKADLGVNVTRGQACALAGRAMNTLA